jgi:hypothetical protein
MITLSVIKYFDVFGNSRLCFLLMGNVKYSVNQLHLLKNEHIRSKTYVTREEERQGVFNSIELFYNPNEISKYEMLSPIDFER